MKYWRGFLVAVIFMAMAFGLIQFAANHTALIDMIYPYMTRLIQSFLAGWSADVSFCLWQLLLMLLGLLLLAGLVLMIVLRLNFIQITGWVCAVASLFFLLHTGLYGLNYHAGSLAEDIHLEEDYNITHLVGAATYYRDKANELASQVTRTEDGSVDFAAFEDLAVQAADGFRTLTYDRALSIFAGSTVPVKKLSNPDTFTSAGITGITMPITGEACVNPNIPQISLPFVMCQEMARRMTIVTDDDSQFAAFLACEANTSVEFRYSAYFMAFLACYEALKADSTSTALAALPGLTAGISQLMAVDMADYNTFWDENLKENALNLRYDLENSYYSAMKLNEEASTTDDEAEDDPVKAHRYNYPELLTCLYVRDIVNPSKIEEENPFDPYDESQVILR